MTDEFLRGIQLAASLIEKSDYVVAITGAGISTPSGIPDFRSHNTGLWEKNDPMRVASLSSFLHKPMDFFNWFHPLAKQIYYANANAAHQALVKMEQANKLKATITQNIDHLHQKAGSQATIEVHGGTSTLVCLDCQSTTPFSDETAINFIENFEIPKCERCKKYLKPAVTLFEELLPMDAWTQAYENLVKADLVIVIGSSLEVSPVNQLPLIALERGAKFIINTFSPTYLDRKTDMLLRYDVVQVWPKIVEMLNF